MPAIVNWEDFPLALRSIIDALNDYAVPDRQSRHIAADAVVGLVGSLKETLTAEVETSPKSGAGSVPLDFVNAIEGTSRHLMDITEDLSNIVKRDRLARMDAVRDLTEALGDLNAGLENHKPRAKPPVDETPDGGKKLGDSPKR